jgi:hypothetical protein
LGLGYSFHKKKSTSVSPTVTEKFLADCGRLTNKQVCQQSQCQYLFYRKGLHFKQQLPCMLNCLVYIHVVVLDH